MVNAVRRHRPQVHAGQFTVPVLADHEEFGLLGLLGNGDRGDGSGSPG